MSPLVTALRWHTKKIARGATALFSMLSGLLWVKARRKTPHVRVLMYHRFRDTPRDPFSVRPEEFASQMRWLAQHQLAISPDDFVAFLDGNRALPSGSVLVSIDDGFLDFLSEAVPIMKRYGIPGICFIPVADVGDSEHVSWAELAALAASGIEVGSHSYNHVSLGHLAEIEVADQLRRSRTELEQRLKHPVRMFAYPYGTRADHNSSTRNALRKVGYTLGFVTQHGAVAPDCDRFTIPRIKVEGGESMWMFRLLVRGGLDAWSVFDRIFWRLRATP